jgi:hypothetical protein
MWQVFSVLSLLCFLIGLLCAIARAQPKPQENVSFPRHVASEETDQQRMQREIDDELRRLRENRQGS